MPLKHPRNDSIPDAVRAQLLALGIPAAKHTPDAIAGLFPREFNIGAADLDAEDLAKVFIHLSTHGILSVAGAGASIRKVEPGWHFCQFYRDYKQLLNMVAPYMAEGLRNNEGCLWVLPAVVTRAAVREVLGRYVKDVDARFDRGQIEVLPHPDWYLDSKGRLKSFEDVCAALLLKQNQALARGYASLRAAGDAGWVSGTEQSRSFIDYEKKVNAAIGATKIAAVCTFRADVSADELVAIVSAHQDALHPAPAS
jgi:hypothetical protein